jgi:molybdopterin-biosynthesis enzyme MoeA-like protein
MLHNVMPTLRTGTVMLSRALPCPFGEGDIGTPLAAVQKAHPDTSIGSYPRYVGEKFSTEIVVRARDEATLDAAIADVAAMIEAVALGKTQPTSSAEA